MRLDFTTGNEAAITLQFDDARWIAPVGLDGKRRFAPAGPHRLSLASVGRWLSDSEFFLDLDTVANINHFLFTVQFDGDRADLRMNEATGEMKDVKVEGIALRRANSRH